MSLKTKAALLHFAIFSPAVLPLACCPLCCHPPQERASPTHQEELSLKLHIYLYVPR